MRSQLRKLQIGNSTKAERRFAEILKRNHIPFRAKVRIKKREIDFLIGKSINWMSLNKIKHYRKISLVEEEKRRKIGLATKKRWENPEYKKRLVEIHKSTRMNQKMPTKETKIEILMECELKNRGIYYQKQIPLENISITDFYIPEHKIAIFCDGDYWHNYPDGREIDKVKTEKLEISGYNIFRFWERDIKKSVKDCVNIVIDFIKKTSNLGYAIDIDGHDQDSAKNVMLVEEGYIPIHFSNREIKNNGWNKLFFTNNFYS